MLYNGFKIKEFDNCFYIKKKLSTFVFVCLYVDDMLIIESNHDIVMAARKTLTKYFNMKDMDITNFISEIQISKIFELILSRFQYTKTILKKI